MIRIKKGLTGLAVGAIKKFGGNAEKQVTNGKLWFLLGVN